jgi:beta-galactosidase
MNKFDFSGKGMRAGLAALALATVLSGRQSADAAVKFGGEFAPQEGLVATPEKPLRADICLNGSWQFQPVALPQGFKEGFDKAPELPLPANDKWQQTAVKVPSPWNANSFANEKGLGGDFRTYPSYPKEWESVKMGWLRRSVEVPSAWQGKRVLLHFNAVAGDARILVNGREVARQFDIFYPFEVDVTDTVKFGANNEILVGVRKASLFDVAGGKYGKRNYQAGSFWGQHAVGIWQDVNLYAVDPVHVKNVFVQPLVDKGVLKVEVTLRNDGKSAANAEVGAAAYAWASLAGKELFVPKWKLADKAALSLPSATVAIPANGEVTVTLERPVGDALKLWSPEQPNLYGLLVDVKNGNQAVDRKYTRFGWRQIVVSGEKVTLNGKPIVLKGDSWHFLGIPQMTRRYPYAWYTALKAANCNAVRLHAQPYPEFYLDVADEMGILVLDETALWASDGGPKLDDPRYWANTTEDVEKLVLRDRNHPSVFGWSICNEIRPVVKYVFHGPDKMMQDLVKHYEEWAAACRRLDPTRGWISADGDDDGEGKLPTFMIHYGDDSTMQHALDSGKPWGVGETSGAYYMTPEQSAKFNGERSYESFLGRMEGIAKESYDSLSSQRKYNASYRSVFNLVWYGLQPLALGLKDTTKAPTLDDGVLFSQYVEGKPGVQPERLGPYCTTLNPGYDSSLPLYKTWPLFDAIKAANSEPPQKFEIKAKAANDKLLPKLPTFSDADIIAGTNSKLAEQLGALGVVFKGGDIDAKKVLYFVDGVNPPEKPAAETVKQILSFGGTVVVWGVSQDGLDKLNALLPYQLALTDRKSSSLLAPVADAITAGLKPSDMYFSELSPPIILDGGLDGALVKKGTVLLEACNTDWLLWNKRAEYAKTGMVLRSEREAKPSGVALVKVKVGKGWLVVSNLPAEPKLFKGQKLVRQVLENLGLPLKPAVDEGGAFLKSGKLVRSLVLGRFPTDAVDKDFINPSAGASFRDKADANGRRWQVVDAEQGSLELLKKPIDGPADNSVTYLSFWLLSPRPLDDLLIEPNMPKLDLKLHSGDALELFFNGKSYLKKPAANGEVVAQALPLQQGWNHFLVRVNHVKGDGKFSAELVCSKPEFLNDLKSATEKP